MAPLPSGFRTIGLPNASKTRNKKGTQMKTKVAVFLPIFIVVLSIISFVPPALGDKLSWRVEYDDQGRIASRIDPAGRVLKYTYAPASGKPVQSIMATPYEGSPVIWKFDKEGKLTNMKDGAGEVAYQYDSNGRLIVVARKGEPAVQYSYDTAGRLSELKVGDFYRIARTYDFLGRITAIETPAGRISYEYLAGQGMVVRSLPNGIKTFYKYKANGELDEITHGFFKNPKDNSHSVLAQYFYAYGPDGRIVAIRERSAQSDIVKRYSYDTMGRLVKATGSGGQDYTYAYDAVGNRIKATVPGRPDKICTFDWAGRLNSMSGKPCAYDESGNLSVLPIDSVARRYHFNPDGRLAEALIGKEKVQYQYDGFGRLITRKATAGETLFLPDPSSSFWQPLVIEEKNGTRMLVIWDGAFPLLEVRGREVRYRLEDHLNSVRMEVDTIGRVIARRDYSPYGSPERSIPMSGLQPAFAGLYWDSMTSVYLTLARTYDPASAHFMQPDPQLRVTGLSNQSQSLYAYCGGDPVNWIDRDGAEAVPWGMEHHGLMITDGNGNAVLPRYRRPLVSHPNRSVWWSAFWKDVSQHLFDANRAKETLATYSAHHLSNARGSGLAAGLTATGLDIIGGYIPGEGGNRGQAYASVAWSLLLGGFSSGESVATALNTVGHTRTASSAMINSFQGNYGSALLDIVSLQGTIFSTKAENLAQGKHLLPTGQIEFDFVDPSVVRQAKNLVAVSDTIDVFGYYTAAYDTYKAGQLPLIAEFHAEGFSRNGVAIVTQGSNLQTYNRTAAHQEISTIRPFDPFRRSPEPKTIRRDNVYDDFKKYAIWWDDSIGGPPGGGTARNFLPSPVGGVYLGGAGKAIAGFGQIRGISLDTNNNLVLLGHDGGSVELPPLRLDDVVTIFRSVYLYGEGPTVTIDPASENPEESAMIIRHGRGTEDTYVGWVLYEADRLMKSYTLGVDSKTQKEVESEIPGYDDVLNAIFFGDESQAKRYAGGHWERFWIVPAEVRRFEAPRKELTLLDVPLKVRTQSMVWKKGKLVDDPKGKSSPGALAFTTWFSGNYGGISGERFLIPPPETGITTPVPVFNELRRIALITAIAEKLRDQGVPMPFWMFDYEVQPVPFEKITPALRVTRSSGRMKSQVFGGVQLSPETTDVKSYNENSDLASLTKDEREAVHKKVTLAKGLENEFKNAQLPVASLKPEKLSYEGKQYQAVSMPGAGTRVLGPLRMAETDISVPLPDGRALELTRRHNSFFAQKGPWGKGWALDLPRLVEFKQPLLRKDSQVRYQAAYELITSLNSVRARFYKRKKVAALNNVEMLVPDTPGFFLGMTQAKPDFLTVSTKVLVLNDGSRWHFSEAGHLVAVVEAGLITFYERDAAGRVARILGLLGRQKVGEIELAYDKAGRLRSAKGKNNEGSVAVNYIYAADGRLQFVRTNSGQVGYHYETERLSKITWQEGKEGAADAKETTIRSFSYNAKGQLVREAYGDNEPIEYHWTEGPQGATAAADGAEKGQIVRFDAAMRPVQARDSYGTQVEWRYPEQDGTQMKISASDQAAVVITESMDKRRVTFEESNGPTIVANKDTAGRLVSLTEDGESLLKLYWQPEGRLDHYETATSAVWQEYDPDGLVTSILVTPTGQTSPFKEFHRVQFDANGRPIEVKDYTGLHRVFQYGKTGDFIAAIDKSSGKDIGYIIDRDKQGRIQSLNSSFGTEKYSYDREGSLRKIDFQRQEKTASIEFESGLIRKMTQFDGAQTALSYYDQGPHEGLLRQVRLANGLEIAYNYNDASQLSKVDVGNQRQVKLDYDANGWMVGYSWQLATQAPSPKKRAPRIDRVLNARIEDNKKACHILPNAIVLDLYKDSANKLHANIHSSNGDSWQLEDSDASDLQKMIQASFASNRSEKVEEKWTRFYQNHLSELASPEVKSLSGGATIKLKPILIINSNIADHKYNNLKKINALRDNFSIFITSKRGTSSDSPQSTATEVAERINAIPPLTKDNVVIAIRPPKEGATKKIQSEWEMLVGELRELVGQNNVVFNPDKKSFREVFSRQDKDIIVIEITHTGEGIRLKGGDEFKTNDVIGLGDLSRIKLLIGGNSCRLPKLDNGKFAQALLRQGVGIINGTYDTVPHDTIVKRMQLLKIILHNIQDFDIPAIYLQDIIDQATSIPEEDKGTTNLGINETSISKMRA